MLRDVLHIPKCKYNLISLRRWEDTGQSYHTKDGILTLYSMQEIPIIQGECVSNNLYWLKFKLADTYATAQEVFTVSWETWHKCFGHISYQSLQSLIKNKIMDSFNPDPKSPMPNCSTCVAAKMTHRPFPKTAM